MRRLIQAVTLALITALTGLGSALAQTANTPFSAPVYYASSFNLWQISSNFGSGPNVFIFPGRTVCNSAGQNVNFFVFATNAPVLIADANTSQSEVITPSSVTNTAGSCGFSGSPSNTHYTFQVRSGTAGLQEAINTLKDQGAWPTYVVLDKNWWTIANNMPGTYATSIIGAAAGDATVVLEDITTAVPTFYVWNGSAFSSTNQTVKNTAPTIAAGAAAGSSPTLANANGSTSIVTTADVTTGTATTTGTLFTETWPTIANGGFQAAGSCSVTSTGANSFTAFTVATSTTGSGTSVQRVLTVTASSAPTASTAYVFNVTCK